MDFSERTNEQRQLCMNEILALEVRCQSNVSYVMHSYESAVEAINGNETFAIEAGLLAISGFWRPTGSIIDRLSDLLSHSCDEIAGRAAICLAAFYAGSGDRHTNRQLASIVMDTRRSRRLQVVVYRCMVCIQLGRMPIDTFHPLTDIDLAFVQKHA